MSYDTGIADRIRAMGVPVVECDGWKSRGSSSFSPRGSVNHHTAGGASGATPSLNTCIYGRPDLAGPLCNVMQSREADGNDKAYVVAAGRANHAGDGGWMGLSGNSSVYGLEIEHTGTSPISEGRQRIAAAIHAGMFGGDVRYVCQHYEWTSRKIDLAQGCNGDTFRAYVQEALSGGGRPLPPPPPPEDDVYTYLLWHPTNGAGYLVCGTDVTILDNQTFDTYKNAGFKQVWPSAANVDAIFGMLKWASSQRADILTTLQAIDAKLPAAVGSSQGQGHGHEDDQGSG